MFVEKRPNEGNLLAKGDDSTRTRVLEEEAAVKQETERRKAAVSVHGIMLLLLCGSGACFQCANVIAWFLYFMTPCCNQ